MVRVFNVPSLDPHHSLFGFTAAAPSMATEPVDDVDAGDDEQGEKSRIPSGDLPRLHQISQSFHFSRLGPSRGTFYWRRQYSIQC